MMITAWTADRDLVALVGDVLDNAERAGSWHVEFDRLLWQRMDDLGLTSLLSRQGATWTDAVTALEECAVRGVALPIAEHDVLSGWLLSRVDAPQRPEGLTVPVTVDARGQARGVPWAVQANQLIVLRE